MRWPVGLNSCCNQPHSAMPGDVSASLPCEIGGASACGSWRCLDRRVGWLDTKQVVVHTRVGVWWVVVVVPSKCVCARACVCACARVRVRACGYGCR